MFIHINNNTVILRIGRILKAQMVKTLTHGWIIYNDGTGIQKYKVTPAEFNKLFELTQAINEKSMPMNIATFNVSNYLKETSDTTAEVLPHSYVPYINNKDVCVCGFSQTNPVHSEVQDDDSDRLEEVSTDG